MAIIMVLLGTALYPPWLTLPVKRDNKKSLYHVHAPILYVSLLQILNR